MSPSPSSHHNPHLHRVVDSGHCGHCEQWTVDSGQTSRLRTRECSGCWRSRHKRAARSRPPFYYSAAPIRGSDTSTRRHTATALTHVPLTHFSGISPAILRRFSRLQPETRKKHLFKDHKISQHNKTKTKRFLR